MGAFHGVADAASAVFQMFTCPVVTGTCRSPFLMFALIHGFKAKALQEAKQIPGCKATNKAKIRSVSEWC